MLVPMTATRDPYARISELDDATVAKLAGKQVGAEVHHAAHVRGCVDLGQGVIAASTAIALKAEARDRADHARFFGHIAHASVLATVPGEAVSS
jgi:hypothetical protein